MRGELCEQVKEGVSRKREEQVEKTWDGREIGVFVKQGEKRLELSVQYSE